MVNHHQTGVSSSAPQGSGFGPTLFNVFFNDLEENIKSLTKFADDPMSRGYL